MITKLIAATICFAEGYNWNKVATGFLIAAEILLGLLLIPLIAIAACIRAMFL